MANVDNPHGLRSLMRNIGGGDPQIREYQKAAATAYALYPGDAVALDTSRRLVSNAGITPGTSLYSGVNLTHGLTSKLTDHQIIVSPDAVYEVQDNNDTDGFAEADMGLNCNLELNAGDATKLTSGHELDESTVQTTNTLDVHMLDKLDAPDNAYGANCRVVVVFNKHRMNPGVAGV